MFVIHDSSVFDIARLTNSDDLWPKEAHLACYYKYDTIYIFCSLVYILTLRREVHP